MKTLITQIERNIRGRTVLLRNLSRLFLDNKEVINEVLTVSKALIFQELMSNKFTQSSMENKDVKQKVYYELMQLIEFIHNKNEEII